jgi:endoglucanase
LRGIVVVCACAVALALLAVTPALGAPNLRVQGNQLVDGPGTGSVVQLRGVNRSGLEYACMKGFGFFDSPHPTQVDSPAMIAAMVSWDINVVRVPLNEDCWLGVNAPKRYSGAGYRRIVVRYVHALEAAHLYVILELHVAAPGSKRSIAGVPMPDRDHAPAFWRSLAKTFKNDHDLIFGLYNEPHQIAWACWRNGCRIPAHGRQPAYRAAGMQQLVSAVRSAGSRQPLLLGGVQYALDLSGWVANQPLDPLQQLVADDHTYGGLSPCSSSCLGAVLNTAQHVPVVFGELGERDCAHGYIDQIMPFADAHGIGYLGWTWDAGGTWTCSGGPTLITNYNGTPTAFGIGFRDHFQALGVPPRPS